MIVTAEQGRAVIVVGAVTTTVVDGGGWRRVNHGRARPRGRSRCGADDRAGDEARRGSVGIVPAAAAAIVVAPAVVATTVVVAAVGIGARIGPIGRLLLPCRHILAGRILALALVGCRSRLARRLSGCGVVRRALLRLRAAIGSALLRALRRNCIEPAERPCCALRGMGLERLAACSALRTAPTKLAHPPRRSCPTTQSRRARIHHRLHRSRPAVRHHRCAGRSQCRRI